MAHQLKMGTGPSGPVKLGIMAGIVAVMGGAAVAMLSGGDSKTAPAHTAAAAPAPTPMTGPADTAAAMTDAADAAAEAPAPAPSAGTETPAATDATVAAGGDEEPAGTATSTAPLGEAIASEPVASEFAATPAQEEMTNDATGVDTPAAQTRAAKKVKKTVAAAPPAADALRAWWTTGKRSPFGVDYVGQAEGQAALVILFSKDVDPGAVAQHVRVIGPDGKPVDARFQPGGVARMVVQTDLAPGRYTVMIDPATADKQGQSLGTQLYGPVYIVKDQRPS